jgi:two-component system OmpR family sensor kinase
MTRTRSDIERMLAERLDFLIGIGHDMRAPLTGIAGFASILAELPPVSADPTASEATAYIRREAQKLVELLNQLLDFGQVEQGRPHLDHEPIDLVRLVELVVDPFAARHPEFTFELVCGEPEVIAEGDFLKLTRVVTNLIDNAVTHSPVGSVISVSVGYDDDEVVLIVQDQGKGVDPEDRVLIFDRFVRRSSHTPGAGIGLYVVRGLVQAHGGSVSVDGDQGARFEVRLPRTFF